MWEMGHKEAWAPKKWCLWIVVLEKTLEKHLNSKEVCLKGNTDGEAEAPIPRPPDMMSQLIWKDPDLGKDWEQ